jgi:hypothetical protein
MLTAAERAGKRDLFWIDDLAPQIAAIRFCDAGFARVASGLGEAGYRRRRLH